MKYLWKRKKQVRHNSVVTRVKRASRLGQFFRRGLGGFLLLLAIGVAAIGGVEAWRSKLSGDGRFTIVITSPSMAIFSYQPQTAEGVLLKIPDAFMLAASHGYGKWRVVAVAGLDTQEGFSGKLVRDSATRTFGVVVDGQLKATRALEIGEREDLRSLVLSALWQKFTGGVETNLSLWDLVRLTRILSTTRIDRIKAVSLDEVTRLLAVAEPDGGVVYTLDEGALADLSRQWFTDENVAKENVTVIVVNEAQVAGLGTTIARVLSIAGVNVVAVENGEGVREKSGVYAHGKLKKSKSLAVIKKLMPEIEALDLGEGERGDIILRLGKDVGKRFGGN
ncbi:MAG: LytR C-terminal domain-containing protein [Candidatus Chisholmbacteria bacterium]|nr:LytR C-terminal domain-containing protein [Candidatus Chisholmbacteria bacterium]